MSSDHRHSTYERTSPLERETQYTDYLLRKYSSGLSSTFGGEPIHSSASSTASSSRASTTSGIPPYTSYASKISSSTSAVSRSVSPTRNIGIGDVNRSVSPTKSFGYTGPLYSSTRENNLDTSAPKITSTFGDPSPSRYRCHNIKY
jgi:hypothetical protein